MNPPKSHIEIEKTLKRHGQSHILAFWDELNLAQKKSLLEQIGQLDFEKIDEWVRKILECEREKEKEKSQSRPSYKDIKPVDSYSLVPTNLRQKRKYDKAIRLGKKLIKDGKVAAFVVAGGQGTRFGLDGPKGNFQISLVKNKTLFQLFAETIAATAKKYKTTCPWYIMTSPLNYDETVDIFHSNQYYGLKHEDVLIFQQGTLPNFSPKGKLLLADKATISCSPDGHGGSFKALYQSGAIKDMKKRGIEYISYWQVDNPLVHLFDPLFIGLHALDEAEMSSKAAIKTDPYEKVGNFCTLKDALTVIEYSEFNKLSKKIVEKRNPDGSLVFKLGSIAIHIINTSFVERFNTEGFSLPLHIAKKKIPYINRKGCLIETEEPNGIKLETFVFDALKYTRKSIILETLREEEFAPVKNAYGVDSAETARQLMLARAARLLESAGWTVPKKEVADCLIEISPSFALDEQELKRKLKKVRTIKRKAKIHLK